MKKSASDGDFEDIKKRLGTLEKGLTGPTLGQTEFMREVEILSDENQRLWRTLTSLEEQFKNVSKQAGIKVKGGQDSGKVSFHPIFKNFKLKWQPKMVDIGRKHPSAT